MPTFPVLVHEWQFACCGEPFAVGDLVHWRLSLTEDGASPAEAVVTVDVVTGERVGSDEHGDDGTLLTVQGGPAAGVTAFGPPRPAGAAVSLTGTFAEDHHELVPESVPLTTGRITRVREAVVEYVRRDDALVPDPSTWELRDVRGFADRTHGTDKPPLFLVDLQNAGV
ncbi:DUF6578 domain-containing protein [Jiangella sp. DSM 45060]|uniref:DUF6578 domain-containing protein n=1 Tax=Jiangella sp. DSM 45060 TaxID=1798224 RepID=UPI00087B85BC|nr:DUF6578 domain-containing protein [Jiangella sp. DSM 45060]SDT67690.1 hypothetical protein SAMN04515669_5758 [Jiangella sp. DSM 45060]